MKAPIFLRIYKSNQFEGVKQFEVSQVIIGTNPDVQLQLKGDGISPIHALIEKRDSGYYISDLGSKAGVTKNLEKVLDSALSSGDEIYVGDYRIEFFIGIPKPLGAPVVSMDKESMKESSSVTLSEKPVIEDEVTVDVPLDVIDSTDNISIASISLDAQPSEGAGDAAPPTIKKGKNENKGAYSYIASGSGELATSGGNEGIKKAPPLGVNGDVPFTFGKRTFAPPSETSNLEDTLKPGRGSSVEVIVGWKERVIGTYHFTEKKTVTVGPGKENDIVLPLLGVSKKSHPLIKIDSLATVCVTTEMSGSFYADSGSTNFSTLIRQNRMARSAKGYEIELKQDEMVRIGFQGELLSIYIRYTEESVKPLIAPFLDLSIPELTSLILSVILSAIFGLYMFIYAPASLDEDLFTEEDMRKAVITFKPPAKRAEMPDKVEIKQVAPPKKQKKKVVKITEKVKKKTSAATKKPKKAKSKARAVKRKKNSGKASNIKPSPSKKRAKTVTSSRKKGGAIKTGKKKGASAKSKEVDVSKSGLLSVFGGKGTQAKLNKTYTGAGELQGLADSSTGYSGQNSDRAGDNIGGKLKHTGAGGTGASTVGIAGVGTKGKGNLGTGTYGTGSGGLGERGSMEMNIGGQEAEFTGMMDKEAIRRVIRSNRRSIKACYDRELQKNPDLFGKLELEWDIVEKGRVRSAHIKSNSLGNKNVANCILRRLRTWRFPEPPPDQVGRVIYPFVFSAK